MSGKAIVSLFAGNDLGYLQGLAALGRSIDVHARNTPRICLLEKGEDDAYRRHAIEALGWEVRLVEPIRCKPTLYSASRWFCTFTKLHAFNLHEFEKVLFLDADCLLCSNEAGTLLDRCYQKLAGCWVCRESPQRFNSGVMLFKPSEDVFNNLRRMVETEDPQKIGAYNGDQSVLNYYFGREWKQIADKYNQRHWNCRKPNVAIAHLRPHPWKRRQPVSVFQKPYVKLWSKRRNEAFGSGRAFELCRRIAGRKWNVAEVGVLNGRTSAAILRHCPNATLHMVDAWGKVRYTDQNDRASRITDWGAIKRQAVDATDRFGKRRIIHHENSVQAAKSFADGSLDLVFIDAEHTREAVSRDIREWLPKVRKGGIICGHDYHRRWPGVVVAVNRELGKPQCGQDATWFHAV